MARSMRGRLILRLWGRRWCEGGESCGVREGRVVGFLFYVEHKYA